MHVEVHTQDRYNNPKQMNDYPVQAQDFVPVHQSAGFFFLHRYRAVDTCFVRSTGQRLSDKVTSLA